MITYHVPAGKIVRLKQKLADVTGAVGKLFGRRQEKDPAVAQLDAVKVSYTATVALVVGSCRAWPRSCLKEGVVLPEQCMPMRAHGHGAAPAL